MALTAVKSVRERENQFGRTYVMLVHIKCVQISVHEMHSFQDKAYTKSMILKKQNFFLICGQIPKAITILKDGENTKQF